MWTTTALSKSEGKQEREPFPGIAIAEYSLNMNIQAEKLNVLQQIINTNDMSLIKDIKSLISIESWIGLIV
ncbi:hypothetical protein [Mucilaginibacter paludis]|uniref:Uncharacterized protein n=1 Tax=Mucilaginibacter paludis DSM 18603 TaxID=714943 RepID=H1Y8I9_9SPHI|nr:hypothetical protein [Mucilaginibacter paludis]EHQ25907.1 hypothetical protein Mucpa_1753 [Mucilaginibacter paludis DSM 18603]